MKYDFFVDIPVASKSKSVSIFAGSVYLDGQFSSEAQAKKMSEEDAVEEFNRRVGYKLVEIEEVRDGRVEGEDGHDREGREGDSDLPGVDSSLVLEDE